MLIEIDGIDAHDEDDWVGATTNVGGATIRWRGHVGRCLTTSRDPDSGEIDLPTLDMLRNYRAELESTEPLPFGIYGEVLRAGRCARRPGVARRTRFRGMSETLTKTASWSRSPITSRP